VVVQDIRPLGPGPTLAVLFETSNRSHMLLKYVEIMVVGSRSPSRIIVWLRHIRGRVLR
jgi:hypothetical protein